MGLNWFNFSKTLCYKLWLKINRTNIFVCFIISKYAHTSIPSTHRNKKIKRNYIVVTEEMTTCRCSTQLNCFITKCSWSNWKHQRIQRVSKRSSIVEVSPRQVLSITATEICLELERTNAKICFISTSRECLVHQTVLWISCLSLFLVSVKLYFPLKWQIPVEKKESYEL